MSATERLRELLDERGVEWTSGDTEVSRNTCTDFCPDAGVLVSVWENDGKLGIDVHTLYRFTTEQAIAATLGPGTCKVETTENWIPAERYHRCKHCGAFFAVLDASGDIPPRVCPNCGRRVVSE